MPSSERDRLLAAARDLEERDQAVTNDAALVLYEQKWKQRLIGLQRAHPNRWSVRGLSDEELRDELTLRLIDAIRSRPDELALHQRPGREWGLGFLAHELRGLRKSFRLNVVLADAPVGLVDRAPNEEERFLALEADGNRALARERAEATLNRPQRRWLAAMKMTANAGAFFESSGKLNLSAVSRLLDKNRSSAVRAYGELSRHFSEELAKLDGE
jgi:hypothetical protein